MKVTAAVRDLLKNFDPDLPMYNVRTMDERVRESLARRRFAMQLLTLFAEEHANVVSVEHHREGMDVPVTETEVEATLLTRDQEHCTAILDAMQQRGYIVDRLH